MGKNFVFSTASTAVTFPKYADRLKGGIPQITHKVTIKGGANVPNAKTLMTPRGVSTEVSDDDMLFLIGHTNFQRMVKNGFMTVASDSGDMEKAVRDMKAKDRCAPKTVDDYTEKLGDQKDGSKTSINAGAAVAA